MQINNAYYSKKKIRTLIEKDAVIIESNALESAKKDFGWDYKKICEALLKIPSRCCYNRKPRFNNPEIWVDYYRAENIMGENIYTHFYVENDKLVIDSFKELYR